MALGGAELNFTVFGKPVSAKEWHTAQQEYGFGRLYRGIGVPNGIDTIMVDPATGFTREWYGAKQFTPVKECKGCGAPPNRMNQANCDYCSRLF